MDAPRDLRRCEVTVERCLLSATAPWCCLLLTVALRFWSTCRPNYWINHGLHLQYKYILVHLCATRALCVIVMTGYPAANSPKRPAGHLLRTMHDFTMQLKHEDDMFVCVLRHNFVVCCCSCCRCAC